MSNPGFYTPLDCIHHYVKAACGSTPPVVHHGWSDGLIALGIVLAVLAVAATTILIITGLRRVFVPSLVYVPVIALGAGAAFAFGFATPFDRATPPTHYASKARDHQHSYEGDLRLWLSSEYDVDIDRAQAETLTGGGAVAVNLDGKTVPITLNRADHGDVAVQQVGGVILSPVK